MILEIMYHKMPFPCMHAQSNQAMLIVHHSASAIIQYARIARKHQLFPVCLDSLSKIHSIPSVPVLDCFQKIRQQVDCMWCVLLRTGQVY